MVFTLVGLVILTAAAIGLPAIWLLWGQLGQHNQQVLEQGGRTAEALISDQINQLHQPGAADFRKAGIE